MSGSERWRDKRRPRRRQSRSGFLAPRRRTPGGIPPQVPIAPFIPPAPAEPPAPGDSPRSGTVPRRPYDLWLALILAVMAAVSFLPALSNDFVWEDRALVADNPALRSPGAIFTQPFMAARPNSFHPLATLSYLADYLVWRLNPVGYHSTNLTLHLIATLLVYAAAIQVLRRRSMAFAAGAIFAAHPVHVQSVAWVAGRPQLLATCLALFAALSYGSYVTAGTGAPTDAPPPARSRARAYYAASLGAFTLALFAHAAAGALLILLPLYEVLLYGERVRRAQSALRRWLPYAGFAAAIVLYLAVRSWSLGYHLVVGFDAALLPAQLAAAPLLAVRALELMLLPVRSQPYIPVLLAGSPLRADVLMALAVVMVMAALALRLRAVSGGAAFGLWWTLLTLALTLNWLPLPGSQFGERELYLPSAGIVMPIAWALISLHDLARARKRPWVRAGITIVFVAAAGLSMAVTWARTQWYANDISLFTRMAGAAPADGTRDAG